MTLRAIHLHHARYESHHHCIVQVLVVVLAHPICQLSQHWCYIIFDTSKHSWLIVEDKAEDLIGPENTFVRPQNILGTLWLDKSDNRQTPVGTQLWNLTNRCSNELPLKLTSVSYMNNNLIVYNINAI